MADLNQPQPAGDASAAGQPVQNNQTPQAPTPQPSSMPANPTQPSDQGGQAKATILIADDDITLRDMYQTRLETDGFSVLVAADGEEALNLIKDKKPDAVLLDIMMPKMNGLDVLAAMKKEESMKSIPVIILTALIQDLTKVKSLMTGADDYLMKSEVMPGEVIKKVETVLAKNNK